MCGWLLGEIFAITAVTGLLGASSGGLFILIWLVGWTVGGFFVLKTFLWNINGREIITVGQGVLIIDRKGTFLLKAKTYDLNVIEHIRVQENNNDGPFGLQRYEGAFAQNGTIKFDYGLKTIKFASGLDEAEAKFIIQKLKERHLLTEKNY